jgi:hypothetical protein
MMPKAKFYAKRLLAKRSDKDNYLKKSEAILIKQPLYLIFRQA